ncbi:MAG TPA: cyclic nucleotide-binding domain-containing protein [Usitatibacter sp.]|nr:cyclic nucleotide-binding domain-containing protein [Usitatibacter sp.]
MSDTVPASFLASLDEEARSQLLSVARPVAFAEGATLVRHGEPARGAYFIKNGAVEAVVTLPGGESLTVARLGPGAIFGEMALIEMGTCTATVRATSAVDGWFVGHEEFRALVSLCTPAAIRLQHAITVILSRRVGALNAQVLERSAQEDRPARPIPPGDPLAPVKRQPAPSFDAAGFLERLPVFARFSADEIAELVESAAYVELPRGHGIFAAGSPSTSAFIVVRGAVEILGIHGKLERRVAVLGPGQLVGHLAVLREAPHSTQAFVREAAILLEIPASAFRQLYFGSSRASSRLRGAVQASLLAAMGRTNRALTRLISQAKLDAVHQAEIKLEAAYHAQLATADAQSR